MNDSKKLTQEEITELLNMLKKTLVDEINFPSKGESQEFDVVGDSKKDLFAVRIYRGKINNQKYELSARIKIDGIPLLELHINPSKPHMNPDGSKIVGDHWHIYTEEHGRRMAYCAENIMSENFVENTITFMDKFHIIKKPYIYFQEELL